MKAKSLIQEWVRIPKKISDNPKGLVKYFGVIVLFLIIAMALTCVSAAGIRKHSYQIIFQYGGITLKRFILIMILSLFLFLIANRLHPTFTNGLVWLFQRIPALCIVFFAFPVVTTWDTALYHVLVKIIQGQLPWSAWDAVRGVGFPLILEGFRIFFGSGRAGTLTGMFLFYQVFLIYAVRLLEKCGTTPDENPLFYKMFSIIICFNPLLLGGFHALLCEFVGAVIAMVSVYYAYCWMNTPTDKKVHFFYVIFFICMTVFSYQLKQTYIAAVIFPMLGAAFFAIIKNNTLKEVGLRVGTLLVCFAVLFLSIKAWYGFLNYAGADQSRLVTTDSTAAGISRNLVQLTMDGKVENIDLNSLAEQPYFSGEEKEVLLSGRLTELEKGNSTIYNVTDWQGNIIDKTVFFKRENRSEIKNEIEFLFKQLKNHPRAVFSSWIKNYFGLADILKTGAEAQNISMHVPTSEVDFSAGNENAAIFYRGYLLRQTGDNVIWIDPLYTQYADIDLQGMMHAYFNPWETSYLASTLAQVILSLLTVPSFKWCILLMPAIFIFSLGYALISKIKKQALKKEKKVQILLLVSSYGFLQTAIHAVLLMAIDRYEFASYAVGLVGILFIFAKSKDEKAV